MVPTSRQYGMESSARRDSIRLEVVSVDGSFAGEFGKDVLAEIVMAIGVVRVLGQQVDQGVLGEDVVAHGSVNLRRVVRHGGCIRVLFMKRQDAPVLIGLNNAKFGGMFCGTGMAATVTSACRHMWKSIMLPMFIR